ncbi:MAG: NAD(P)-dependent oxidoreductase, partial [Candidatus Liptonbacteria bacterium]|nr:NAD(P)-dependent oxidoreductase [Candidatus Liptonbacteria bacterium]
MTLILGALLISKMREKSSTKYDSYKDFYKGKKVLVTGGTGFAGSFVVKKLIAAGARVCVAFRSSGGTIKKMDRLRDVRGGVVKMINLDLLDDQAVYDVISTSMPAIVVNAAAVPSSNRSLDILDDQIRGNFITAVNLVKAAAKNKIEKFVHIGSIAEYGDSPSPFVETMREQPTYPYSLSKIMATHAVLMHGKLSGMATTVVRPAAIFGPAQDFGLMLIPNIIKSVIDGKDFDMNPGDQIRDFVYVEDLVDGILLAGASSHSNQQIFNLGGNKGYKVKDIATTINRLMGNSIRINFGAEPYRPLDPMECFMDASKA